MNECGVKSYEQLEASTSELENQNCRLVHKNRENEMKIENLTEVIEDFEKRCDQLQKSLDMARILRK